MFNLLVGPSELGKTTVLEVSPFLHQILIRALALIDCGGASINNEFDARSALATLFHKLSPDPIRLGLV